MIFNSYEFLIFLAFVVVGYRISLGLRTDVRKILLILASLVFYAWWRLDYVVILLASIVFNFTVGNRIAAAHIGGQPSKAFLTIGIVGNLALLAYFKYAAFGVSVFNEAAGLSLAVPVIALPLAISFFTFQQISYLVDASRGGVSSYRFIDYLLFVTFFPQLIAGPIVHHGEMMPQFKRQPRKSRVWSDCSVGLTIFVIGLFKKTVIADNIAPIADAVFYAADQGQQISFSEAWCGNLAYTFQIYFDFSGYSDMAVGLARLFGIRLPINFFSPYKATSIIDFWRRWHITLSRFLRDYLYIPLGGNRKGPARRHANLMLTMLLGGLWHGAGWTFILWGGLHGLYLILNHAWRRLRLAITPAYTPGRFERAIGLALTFLAVAVAWAFFRADSFDGALNLLAGMAGLNGFTLSASLVERMPLLEALSAPLGMGIQPDTVTLPAQNLGWMVLAMGIVWLTPNCAQLMRRYTPVLDPTHVTWRRPLTVTLGRWRPELIWRPTVFWLVFSIVTYIVGYLFMAESSFTPFLYFNF